MSLVVIGSQKGSPGATLTALATAAAWPRKDDRDVCLVEADPDGGVLAVRYRLARDPGLLTLAADGRHGFAGTDIWHHTQALPGGLRLVVGPDQPDQAAAALRSAGTQLGPWLRELEGLDVIVDVGRLGPASPALQLATEADVLLMVARPVAEQIQPAAERLKSIASAARGEVGWCLIGSSPHRPEEVEAVHGLPVLGVVADDPRAASALAGQGVSRRTQRSALARSATALALRLAEMLRRRAADRDDLADGITQ